jgi:hypothetical protein
MQRRFFDLSLIKLLAINLAGGVVFAMLVVGGLLLFDAHGLGRLLLHDRSPALAVGLLLFGFVVTLGSWVMGTAIMQIGRER